jgi:ribonuclease HI
VIETTDWNLPAVILNPSPADLDSSTSSATSGLLLVCEAYSESLVHGGWQFTLEHSDGTPVFSAADTDRGDLNRLTLLAAVRGLESIDGPARVTLLSNNRYLIRSLSDSLPRWRQNNFVWEHFGRRIEVQNADLWRRISRALTIHRVEAVLISSRLVSGGVGSGAAATEAATDAAERPQLRIDPPHPGVRRPRDRQAAQPTIGQDRLRQWLMGGAAAPPSPTVRDRLQNA